MSKQSPYAIAYMTDNFSNVCPMAEANQHAGQFCESR